MLKRKCHTAEKQRKFFNGRQESLKRKTKLTYAEQMEFDKLEKEIDDLDERKAELQEEMNNVPGSDYGRLGDLQRQIDEIDQRSEEAMERWEYLGQYV